MRIAQVIPYFTRRRGGSVASTGNLSIELSRMGHDVTILTTDLECDTELLGSVENANVTVLSFPHLVEKGQFVFSPSMKAWLKGRGSKFDIFHMHNFRSYQNNIVHDYAVRNHVPYVLQAHGSVSPFFEKILLKKTYDLVWGKNILEDASRVIALNQMEFGQYRAMGVEVERIEIIPNGIRLGDFQILPDKGHFRKTLGIASNDKLILYVGRISRIKGIDLLLDAFSEIEKRIGQTKLAIVGPDDGYRSHVKLKIETLGLSNRVLVVDALYGAQKLEAYVDSDILVLPSSYEIFGNVLLESLACGTPVVTTDRCGIADLIRDIGGRVIPYDTGSLSKALLDLLENDEKRRHLGENGLKLVRERFDWSKIVIEMESLYKKCIV